MWGREAKLVRLYEEVENLDVLDRVHDYGADDPNRGDDEAYVGRQQRRSEISAEIAKLGRRKPWFEGLGAASVAALLCATLYVTFHYLLK